MDLGVIIPTAAITAFAATSITAADLLRNSRWGINHFSSLGTIIYRPGAASAADYVRYAGDLAPTTGALSHTGANYSDTTVGSEGAELWYHELRPDKEFLDAVNRALEFVFYSTYVPLSHLSNADGDMALATDTNWTDVGTPTTSAKDATPAYTPYGVRNYHTVGNAVNEGTQSATVTIRKEAQLTLYTIGSALSGTASLQPYDVTNSAAITTTEATTSDERHPMLMKWYGSVPATCEAVAAYMIGTTNPSDIYWNGAWLYNMEDLKVNFPSYVSEQFMAPSIFQLRPRTGGASSSTWAASGEMVRLTEGVDYDLQFHHLDANPYAAIFRSNESFSYPLFIQARRPYSDQGALSAEADTTNAPIHQLIPAIKLELLTSTLMLRDPENRKWGLLFQKANAEWENANIVRAVKKVAHREVFGGIRRA